MAFESHRARGSAPSATTPAAALAVAPATVRAPGERAFGVARTLLSFFFVVYLAVVGLSVAGLKPLAGRTMSVRILVLAAFAACLVFGLSLGGSRLRARAAEASVGEASLLARAAELHGAPLGPWLRGVGWGVLGVGLLTTLGAWLLAWLLPVGAYDALGYRLPAVAQWLDAGAVAWVVGDDPLRNGYPLGLEVVEAALFRALGVASAVDCVASAFVLAGAAALAGFARRLGVPRALAALAAGLFLLVPMHLLNAPSGYADAAFAGALVACLIAVARWVAVDLDTEQPHAATEARLTRVTHEQLAARFDLGLTAALVIALKPHGLAFVALALALGLGLRCRTAGLRRAAAEFGLPLALAAPGLFFAVRNVVVTGNPLYPLELRVGGHLLLRGEGSLDGILTPTFNVPAQLAALPSWLRPLWVWLQPYGPATEFDDRLAGFGYAFVLLGLPALVWGGSAWGARLHQACLRSRARGRASTSPARTQSAPATSALARTLAALPGLRPAALRGLSVVGGLTFVCWLVQPFAFWPRFTSWLWGAAALSLSLLLSALVEQGRGRGALAIALALALLALPEALYALAHVKRIDQLGLLLLEQDAITSLSRVAGVDAGFVRRVLVGKRDVCRTPWRLGTDDANIDGVAAQLVPRPRVHVLKQDRFSSLIAAARERGCDQLIVIGDNPVLASAPSSWARRFETVTAFGSCRLVPVLSAEVTP